MNADSGGLTTGSTRSARTAVQRHTGTDDGITHDGHAGDAGISSGDAGANGLRP
jgi:hypothetical protein